MATVKARSFNLADLFEIVAEAVPQRPALLCGPLRLTFAALEDLQETLCPIFVTRYNAVEGLAILVVPKDLP